ncbi:MAG: hypothetical protein KC618_08245, partial [Candidatus Omnitrophica bacterium]|nr:hypothetical protein [Candidatus Omnitrophota bacterium]
MAKRNYLYFIFLLLTVLVFSTMRTAQAEMKTSGADFLVEVGIDHYNKGEVEQAIHEFSKALMLNPDHPVALEYLDRFGIRGGIYHGSATQNSQMADLARYVQKYRNQLDYLEYQNMEMEQRMNGLKTDNDTLVKQRQANDLVMERMQNKLDYFEAKLNRERSRRADMIAQVQDMYKGGGSLLRKQHDLEEERHRRLVELDFKRKRLLDRSLQQEKELFKIATTNNVLREENFKLKNDRDIMLNKVEDYLYVQRNELDKLRDEALSKEMELAKAK